MNLHLTPEFERHLAQLMRLRKIPTKSEAIRIAVRESLERMAFRKPFDFSRWAGAALKAAPNPKPRFQSDDDLWEKESGR